MKKILPKKSLGQNFLLNPTTIDKILRLANVGPKDRILEIGPGPGIMTERLAGRAAEVVAVEKDRRFFEALRERLGGSSNLKLIEGDFLSMNIEKIVSSDGGKWKVIANLPYNIATEAIFHLLDFNYLFTSFYLMVQREVAERLVAKPGGRHTKDFGILSVFGQLFSENRIVMRLPPGAFTPPPKVHSALVEFKVSEGCRYSIHDLPTLESVVQTAFGQRRKMIRNTLRTGLVKYSEEKIDQALGKAGVPPSARAEALSIDRLVRIANELSRSV